jgi:hypothetical protein
MYVIIDVGLSYGDSVDFTDDSLAKGQQLRRLAASIREYDLSCSLCQLVMMLEKLT